MYASGINLCEPIAGEVLRCTFHASSRASAGTRISLRNGTEQSSEQATFQLIKMLIHSAYRRVISIVNQDECPDTPPSPPSRAVPPSLRLPIKRHSLAVESRADLDLSSCARGRVVQLSRSE